jgi:hypothetical protein
VIRGKWFYSPSLRQAINMDAVAMVSFSEYDLPDSGSGGKAGRIVLHASLTMAAEPEGRRYTFHGPEAEAILRLVTGEATESHDAKPSQESRPAHPH